MSIRHFRGRHRAATGAPAARHASPVTRKGRRSAVVAVGAAALLGGGVALAAWTVSGQGTGGAKAVEADDILVENQAVPTLALFPGGSAAVTLGVKNPLPYTVTLTNVDYGAVTSSTALCSTYVTAAPDGPLAADIVLGPEETTFRPVELDDALQMSTAAVDACKGATFSVEVSFSGVSS